MTTTCKHTKSGVTSDTSPYRLASPYTELFAASPISNYIEFYYLHKTFTALSRPRTRLTSYIVTIRMVTIRVTTGFCFFTIGKVVNFLSESIFSSSHDTL